METPWNSYENLDQYAILFPILPDYVSRDTIGPMPETLGLSKDVSPHLLKKIRAALASHFGRISLSYAERTYVADPIQSRWFGMTDRIDDIYDYGRTRLESYVSAGLESVKSDEAYQDLSMQFFFRNLVAFDASKPYLNSAIYVKLRLYLGLR